MQKLALSFLLSLCTFVVYGQGYRVLVDKPGEIPVIDVLRSSENTFDVARFTDSPLNFSTAVLTEYKPNEIVAAYIKTGTKRAIGITRSLDGGESWQTEPLNNNWDGQLQRSLSLFNLGQPSLHHSRVKRSNPPNSLILFSGGTPITISSSYTNGEHWSNFYPANNFGGFRVSGLVRLRDGRHMAFFHDDGRFLYESNDSSDKLRKSVIYKMISNDGGLTWGQPEIALKHNLHGLYDAVVIYSPDRKDNDLVLICSDRASRIAYISYSRNHGETWSYPQQLPAFLQGDRFGMAAFRNQLLISYRDMRTDLKDGSPNPTYGDLVMWAGDLNELVRGNRNGIKMRIADNYPGEEAVDHSDLKFSDCGYPSVLPLGKNKIAVIAYGRWEKEEFPFIWNFILDPVQVRRFMSEQPK